LIRPRSVWLHRRLARVVLHEGPARLPQVSLESDSLEKGSSVANESAFNSGRDTRKASDAPISPLGTLRVAITVDDMMLLRGWPHAPGHNPMSTTRAFVSALASAGIQGVYQFSNTGPLEDDASLKELFEVWMENGHYVGNHTHTHAVLNWMSVEAYRREIQIAEGHLSQYIDTSPHRYFRFTGDFWGDTAAKRDAALQALEQLKYTPIPVTVGFHDNEWTSAYRRLILGDLADDAAWLRSAYVESAVHQLRVAAANARAVFGRDPVHIWLVHGTSIAADTLEQILERFHQANVAFVSIEEAMNDPMNGGIPPFITSDFMFQIEKWGNALGVPLTYSLPDILEDIEHLHPLKGEMSSDKNAAMLNSILAHSEMRAP
jgi:peptidoglycan/xylan/chitin deacetylase (PgdA/CDA1 family)